MMPPIFSLGRRRWVAENNTTISSHSGYCASQEAACALQPLCSNLKHPTNVHNHSEEKSLSFSWPYFL